MTDNKKDIAVFQCAPNRDCEHDWSGPLIQREFPSGAFESGATCVKCGTYFGDWALWNLP